MNLRRPDLPEGRHDVGAFAGELARSVLAALFIATPWAIVELCLRVVARLRGW